jgi:hypothetical protein
MLLARQVRVYPESEQQVQSARCMQIRILESVAGSNLCAGVVRYELAHLYDLAGMHVEALLLHAIKPYWRLQYWQSFGLPAWGSGRHRQANTGCSKWATRVIRPCSASWQN